MRYFTLTILTCIFSSFIFAVNQAYVDTDYIIENSLEYKERAKVVEEKRSYAFELLEEKDRDIKKIVAEIEMVGDDKKLELRSKYMEEINKYKFFFDEKEREIAAMAQHELSMIAGKIKRAINEVSAEKKYDLVFDVKAILYLNEKVIPNISVAVLDKMNEDYRKEKSRITSSDSKTSPSTTNSKDVKKTK